MFNFCSQTQCNCCSVMFMCKCVLFFYKPDISEICEFVTVMSGGKSKHADLAVHKGLCVHLLQSCRKPEIYHPFIFGIDIFLAHNTQ